MTDTATREASTTDSAALAAILQRLTAMEEKQASFAKKVNRELRDGRLGARKESDEEAPAAEPKAPTSTDELEARVLAGVELRTALAAMPAEMRTEFEGATTKLDPRVASKLAALALKGVKPTTTAEPSAPTAGRGPAAATTTTHPHPRNQLDFARLPKEAREGLMRDASFDPSTLPAR